MGNWTTSKQTTYFNVRLTKDAVHFPAKGEQGAATFLSIVDGTKGGEDIFIDCKVTFGAEKLANLKKGQEVTVIGTVEFKINEKTGKLQGKIWNAKVEVSYAVRQALSAEAAAPPSAEAPVDMSQFSKDDGDAPAFD